MKKTFVRLGAAVFVIGVILTLAGQSATKSQHGTVVTTDTSTQATTAPQPTTTTTMSSERSQLHAWYTSGGAATLSDLSNASSQIGSAGGDAVAMRAACQNLQGITLRALSNPIPVASVNEPYLAGIRAFTQAAQLCISGIDNTNPDELSSAVTDLQEANTDITQASSAIDAINAGQ